MVRPKQALARTASLQDDLREALDLVTESTSSNTKRAYAADRADWEAYAKLNGLTVFPIAGDALCAYIGHLVGRGLSVSTIERRCSALSSMHRDRFDDDGEPIATPLDSPKVRTVLRGLRRRRQPPKQKKPLTGSMIWSAREHLSQRDWLICAAGFITGRRRSELAELVWDDVQQYDEGIALKIRFSKTDQEGKGQVVAIPFAEDPHACVARGILTLRPSPFDGTRSVFGVCAQTINRIVKRLADLLGEDASEYGGHSMRAGLATSSSMNGIDMQVWMKATGHKTVSVAQRYVRISAFENPAFKGAVESIVRAKTLSDSTPPARGKTAAHADVELDAKIGKQRRRATPTKPTKTASKRARA